MSISTYDLAGEDLVNKSIFVLGGSATGKTTVLRNVILEVAPFVTGATVVCPSDKQNKSYSGGNGKEPLVPTPMIHHKFDIGILEKVKKRQEKLLPKYDFINNIRNLENIFNRVADKKHQKDVNEIYKHKSIEIDRIKMQDGSEKELEELHEKYIEHLQSLFKKYIIKNKDYILSHGTLDESEKYIVENIEYNINYLVILDDISSDMKQVKNAKIIDDYIFMSRHFKVTFVLASHGSSIVSPQMRQNFHISIFTDGLIMGDYVKKMEMPKDEKRLYVEYSKEITNSPPYTKLIYFKESSKFAHFSAKTFVNKTIGGVYFKQYTKMLTLDEKEVTYADIK